jgi:hexokinase
MSKPKFMIKFSAYLSDAEINAIAAILQRSVTEAYKAKTISSDTEGLDRVLNLYRDAYKKVIGEEPLIMEIEILSDGSQKVN